ncbi:MAG: alpha/beta hydrolase [Candidatus Marinimicrobia bacterium]|nr:alpha/beta hydrolase [Candidatus Neomarinimicrobiota bacterium]
MYSSNDKNLIDRILQASLKLARMKDRNTLETFKKMRKAAKPPKIMENMFSISTENAFSRNIWTLAPFQNRNKYHILFLHGGSYTVNITPVHWFLIGALINKLQCTVIVPDFPLAPEHNAEDVFEMMVPVYKGLVEKVGSKRLILMGDSSGGGLALALSQNLHENGIQQASGLFLLSPWLDVNMDNPEIQSIDKLDPILNIKGLIDCGIAYAGELDRKNYLISPLFGSMEGLPPIKLFVGTHDILMPDCRKFKEKAENTGLDLDYHEIKGLLHDGMLYPTPEGKLCRAEIIKKLRNTWKMEEHV